MALGLLCLGVHTNKVSEESLKNIGTFYDIGVHTNKVGKESLRSMMQKVKVVSILEFNPTRKRGLNPN